MLNRRMFPVLTVATVILVILAVLLGRPAAHITQENAAHFFPALSDNHIPVSEVIIHADNAVITLKKNGDTWGVAERNLFPANTAKIRELLQALTEATTVEAKTSDPGLYDKLGLDEKSGKAVRVTMKSGETTLGDVFVGNSIYRPAGNYVRRNAEAQSYLIDRSLSVSHELKDWLRAEILNLPATKMKLIERVKLPPSIQCIRAPCEAVEFSLSKDSEAANEFALTPMPDNKVLKEAYEISALSDALNNLTAVDVLKKDQLDLSAAQTVVTRYTQFDGLIVLVSHSMLNDKHYVGVSASATDNASDEIKKSVVTLNQQHADWIYEVSNYKGEGLAKILADLVKDKSNDSAAKAGTPTDKSEQ